MGSGTLCLLGEGRAAVEAARQEIDVGGAAEIGGAGVAVGTGVAVGDGDGVVIPAEVAVGKKPRCRDFSEGVAEGGFVESIAGEAVGGAEIGGPREEDVRPAGGKDGGDGALAGVPVVLPKEGGAMVDEAEGAVPEKEVGVAGRAVDVGEEGVEPDDQRGFGGRGGVAGGGVEHAGAGEEVHADVPADAALEQIADLGVGLVAAEFGVDAEEDELGDGEAEGAGDGA